MNHPEPEDWIAYLYREVDSTARSRLQTHLAECDLCRSQLETWKRVSGRLDRWKIPVSTVTPIARWPVIPLSRWAAAALLMIALGFAVGRSSAPSQDVATIREELRGELTELVQSQIGQSTTATLAAANEQTTAALRQFMNLYQGERATDNRAIATALSKLEETQAADFISLRKDLETVALNSDAGLRQTRQQLVRLADYSLPTSSTSPIHP